MTKTEFEKLYKDTPTLTEATYLKWLKGLADKHLADNPNHLLTFCSERLDKTRDEFYAFGENIGAICQIFKTLGLPTKDYKVNSYALIFKQDSGHRGKHKTLASALAIGLQSLIADRQITLDKEYTVIEGSAAVGIDTSFIGYISSVYGQPLTDIEQLALWSQRFDKYEVSDKYLCLLAKCKLLNKTQTTYLYSLLKKRYGIFWLSPEISNVSIAKKDIDVYKVMQSYTDKEPSKYAFGAIKKEGDKLIASTGRQLFVYTTDLPLAEGLYEVKNNTLVEYVTDVSFPRWQDVVRESSEFTHNLDIGREQATRLYRELSEINRVFKTDDYITFALKDSPENQTHIREFIAGIGGMLKLGVTSFSILYRPDFGLQTIYGYIGNHKICEFLMTTVESDRPANIDIYEKL